jgi:hypothetical protein
MLSFRSEKGREREVKLKAAVRKMENGKTKEEKNATR